MSMSEQGNTEQLPPQPPKKKHHTGLWALAIIGVVVIAIIAAGIAAGSPKSNTNTHTQALPTYSPYPIDTSGQTQSSPKPAKPAYTVAQQQAIASAESYISSGQGFSKLGLIHQLDSKYGEGFSKKLAIFAVNHVQVNWNRQAVMSAKGYMQSQPGWSYAGLVGQLHSPYGESFTLAQAKYAAHSVGL